MQVLFDLLSVHYLLCYILISSTQSLASDTTIFPCGNVKDSAFRLNQHIFLLKLRWPHVSEVSLTTPDGPEGPGGPAGPGEP